MTVRRWCAAAQGSVPCLNGQRRWNQRLCRRLARAPEAVAERPEGRLLPGSPELPRAARRALRRHRSRAGALPRGHFDYAAVQGGLREDQAVARRLSKVRLKRVSSRPASLGLLSIPGSASLGLLSILGSTSLGLLSIPRSASLGFEPSVALLSIPGSASLGFEPRVRA